MLLLVGKSLPEIRRINHESLGMLFQPRNASDPQRFFDYGIPWAADNDCFQGLEGAIGPFLRMLGSMAYKPGCLFVAAPDVVGDWEQTRILFDIYAPVIQDVDLPAAVCLQDGATEIPADANAVFIGGSTAWKLSEDARRLVDMAKERGLWTHMGRVNTYRRMVLAASWGIDSVDGSGWARYFDTYIKRALEYADSGQTGLGFA